MIKQYSVTLEEETVKLAKEKVELTGQKLSPILGLLLDRWLEDPTIIEKKGDGELNG